ncbi:hypothetical protein RYX36_006907 [Vicia faba]
MMMEVNPETRPQGYESTHHRLRNNTKSIRTRERDSVITDLIAAPMTRSREETPGNFNAVGAELLRFCYYGLDDRYGRFRSREVKLLLCVVAIELEWRMIRLQRGEDVILLKVE